ncbi:hypothetical protein NEMIN01_1064 [Nematocida minor]|uniref:uncharacterized protein n=1 Tax=Nematocida minor TaxID=1912983 RepID=UPI0022209CB2|nr:uncharacterized protein NEMIN01_1064 [Nematocida minor]KAI5190526.1 hypothetical protein NEMIN01_1064 [Nematocida minor]
MHPVFFLIICITRVWSFDIENLDREYYMITNKTKNLPENYPNTQNLSNSKDSDKSESAVNIGFIQVEIKEELAKSIPLIEKIERLIGLSTKELVHTDNNNKIVLAPFKSIKLVNDDGEINVGSYKNSYIRKDKIVQEYTGGDRCDICKSKRWSGTIHYMVDAGDLELSGPVESSTCNYKLIVKGKDLGSVEKYTVLKVTDSKGKEEEAVSENSLIEENISHVCDGKSCRTRIRIGDADGPQIVLESEELPEQAFLQLYPEAVITQGDLQQFEEREDIQEVEEREDVQQFEEREDL